LKENVKQVDVETQMNDDSLAVIKELKEQITRLEEDIVASKFCIEDVAKNDQLITFYTGYPSYYLGPGVSDLQYWGCNNQDVNYGRDCCQISMNGMGSTFLGLGLFHCCSLSVHVKNSDNFPDAQNSTSP